MTPALLWQLGTNLDLGNFQFGGAAGLGNPVFLAILVAFLLVVAAVSIYLYYTRRRRMQERAYLREEARLRLLLSELGLSERYRDILAELAESDHPADIIPLVNARTVFEQRAEDFRERHPEHPLVKRLPRLRQRLGYGFDNPRNPFTNTRMLAPGTKLQCTIPHPRRPVSYITSVVATGEGAYLVRPPMARGRPLKLTAFGSLSFRVSREGDAEYEFDSPVLRQMQEGMRAVRMGHTKSIRKLLYREAPRIPVELELPFYVVRQEVAAERRHRAFRREQSQYVLKGRTRDLSLGGLALVVDRPAQQPMEGDLLVFALPDAQIKDDLVAEVLDTVSPAPERLQIHARLVGMKEINRLKLSRFLQLQQEPGAPPAGQAASST